ncbi:MAG: ATP synthase F1 subunit delta [bacterium]|nr:ATP synthase F1 subunit delta [bacterium]
MTASRASSANLDAVTTRWAGALFNLAHKAGALDDVSRDMERIGAEMKSSAVRAFFLGKASLDEKRAKLGGVSSDFHPLTKNFVNLIFDRRREEVLLDVAEAFDRRRNADAGVAIGIVESAHPLGTAELDQLTTALGERLKKTVKLSHRTNPDLVAGVRVIVGSQMIDYSVQGRMDGLRRKMMEARLPVGQA